MATSKVSFLALAFLALLLVPTHTVLAASHPAYAGFASPVASFSINNRNITFANTGSSSMLSIATSDTAVYRFAYVSFDGASWKPVTLSGTTLGGAWLNGSSTASITIRPENFSIYSSRLTTRRNFVVTYTCSRNSTGWDCHDGWQIWQFNASLQAQSTSWSDGLVSWWKFNGNADDEQGDNDGQLMNGAGIASDAQAGNVLSLDGADDFVSVPDSTSLDITDEITLSAWVKLDSFSNYAKIIVKPVSGGSDPWELYSLDTGAGGVVRFILSNGSTNSQGGWFAATASSAITLDEWHHILGTYDGESMRLYVDGSLADTNAVGPSSIASNDQNLIIGTYPSLTSIDGSIDDVVVFDRSLSFAQVLELYDYTWNSTVIPTCSDGSQNQGETGVDCGGPCPACPTCSDGLVNGNETGTDCGGIPCPACECTVPETRSCIIANGAGQETRQCNLGHYGSWDSCLPTSCNPGYHISGAACAADSCTDGIQNQGETGVDCGGTCSTECLNYYVSNSGSDSNNGTKPYSAWRTISKVNGMTFSPGDRILFRRGDTWRESLTVSSSGIADAYITYSAYGEGDKPKLLGSEPITSWSPVDGEDYIWASDQQVTDPSCGGSHVTGTGGSACQYGGGSWFVFDDGAVEWGRREKHATVDDLSNLTTDFDWAWVGENGVAGASGVVYIYSTSDPNGRFLAQEVSARQNIITLNAEFVALDNLDLRYAQSRAVGERLPQSYRQGLILHNNHVGYIGIKEGSAAFGFAVFHSDAHIYSNSIHECGRRGISYDVVNGYDDYDDPAVGVLVENVLIENNSFFDGYHTVGLDLANSPGGNPRTFRNVTIRYNLFYKNDVQKTLDGVEETSGTYMFIFAHLGANITQFHIYENIFKSPTGGHIYVGGPGSITDFSIHNNVFYDFDQDALGQMTLSFYYAPQVIFMANNIFVTHHTGGRTFMYLRGYPDVVQFSGINYNIYYNTIAANVMYVNDGTGTTTPYLLSNFVTYQSVTGFDQNSVVGDPLFVNPENFDFHVNANSPAIDAGMRIPGYHCPGPGDGYTGCKKWYGTAPDIGVYEYAG